MTESVIILIDCGYFDNINRYSGDTVGKKISFEKVSEKITEGKNHIRTKIYHSNPYKFSESPEETEKYRRSQQFFYAINRIPRHEFVPVGRVKPVYTHCPKCKEDFKSYKQKGVDVAIALDLVRRAQKRTADIFALICGDEELSDAVTMAQENPCNVIVYFCYDPDYHMYYRGL